MLGYANPSTIDIGLESMTLRMGRGIPLPVPQLPCLEPLAAS